MCTRETPKMPNDQANPYEPSVVDSSTTTDLKRSKYVDNLYRNSKQMVLLTCLGFLVPVVLIIAAPLGLLYAFQRSRLLKKVSEATVQLSAADAEKISFLRDHSLRFYAPAIIVGLWVLFIVSIVATS